MLADVLLTLPPVFEEGDDGIAVADPEPVPVNVPVTTVLLPLPPIAPFGDPVDRAGEDPVPVTIGPVTRGAAGGVKVAPGMSST